MLTVEFLSHVLAHDGYICIDIKFKDQKGFKHHWFNTFETAAEFALQMDEKGLTVYFACGTFKQPINRKQDNCLYLKSFWLDVDVGPGKKYQTRAQAWVALTKFLAATGMPVPLVVHSGPYGLHLYWVLEEPLTPEQWKPYAQALRELCRQHEFHVDPTRTADCASVLRPVGTHNRKELPYRVAVATWAPPVARIDLPLLRSQPRMQTHAPTSGRLLDCASVYNNRPSDPHKIAAECAQIGQLRDMKGDVPYTQWLYAIWTLHHASNGDAVAHEWSSGSDKYSYADTQSKLDQARAPITCQEFSQHNKLCESCSHWGGIKSPIVLGYDLIPALVPPREMNGVEVADNYINDDHGLRFKTENKKGEPVETLISKWPIHLISVCKGELNNDHSLVLFMPMPHGDKSLTIPSGVLFSNQGMSELHRLGAVIHHPDHLRDYVRKRVDTYNNEHAPQTQYSQFGWKDHGNSFLVGTKLYTQSQIITVTGSPEVERRARMLGPRTGSLAAWTAAANKLFAEGCEPHSFALMCAFGAPLMRFLSEDEGGAIVNLVSELSATGKTTGLEMVASVWGELDGLRLLDEDTQISRGVFLGTLGNLPCVFDELHNRDPDSIRKFVTMFTNGRDKLRAKADGTLRDPSGDWQTILILGSNISLTDIIQSRNTEEAQQFRILELVADPKFTGHEGDKLRRQLKENAGWAGDAFIRYLMGPGVLEATRIELDKSVAALWDPWYGLDRRHRFWIRAIGCAYVAGRLAVHLGLLDFDPGRIVEWVVKRCQERKDTDSKRDNVQVLNEALYEVWASTLVVDIEYKPHAACLVLNPPSQNRAFLARRVRDSGRLYINRTWLRKWLAEHGISRTAFIKDLKTRHVIVNDNKYVTLGAGTEFAGGGQIVCIEIDIHHPDMAGALEAAERDVPPEERAKKPLSSLLRSRSSTTPSPPSTLQ